MPKVKKACIPFELLLTQCNYMYVFWSYKKESKSCFGARAKVDVPRIAVLIYYFLNTGRKLVCFIKVEGTYKTKTQDQRLN